MISIENLTVEFGLRPLFKNVSFIINDNDRIALVGKNGAGKSTMLKIINGSQKPTEGVVATSSELTIGYLPQVMVLQDSNTVMEEAKKAFEPIIEMKKHIDALNEEVAKRTDYESPEYAKLLETFTLEHERYTMLGGDNYESEIDRTLIGLGFTRKDFERPTSEFSGGWRMRIELAKILLRHPDVLLLDEPTNHLDIESIGWLERFLQQSGKAVVLVSHDRAFINNVTNRTIEISCGKVYDYKVKYDEYVKLRGELYQQQLRAYENQQKEIAAINDFIEKFRYKPTKAVQVQSRIKQLEKIVPIEIDEIDKSMMHLKFPPCLRSGDYPIICNEVAKKYGEHTVFSNVTLTIKRGEKVAFVGKNGEGKSTLVKCIMGEILFDGELKVGHNVQIGYFAQNQAQLLDENLSVFDTIDNVAKGEIRLKIKNILGAFMFGGEGAEKKVKVLSGGERSRLAMIKLLLEPVNLLILDEPTNHLDIPSKEILKEAINAFDGTAIIVSHDREFLDGLVSKVYEFGNGRVKEHIGGIYDYLNSHGIEDLKTLGASANKIKSTEAPKVQSDEEKTTGKKSYAEHKEYQKQIRRTEKLISECEKRIESMENRIAELDGVLCTPEGASNMELITEYTSIKKCIETEETKWTDLLEKLESLKTQ